MVLYKLVSNLSTVQISMTLFHIYLCFINHHLPVMAYFQPSVCWCHVPTGSHIQQRLSTGGLTNTSRRPNCPLATSILATWLSPPLLTHCTDKPLWHLSVHRWWGTPLCPSLFPPPLCLVYACSILCILPQLCIPCDDPLNLCIVGTCSL